MIINEHKNKIKLSSMLSTPLHANVEEYLGLGHPNERTL